MKIARGQKCLSALPITPVPVPEECLALMNTEVLRPELTAGAAQHPKGPGFHPQLQEKKKNK